MYEIDSVSISSSGLRQIIPGFHSQAWNAEEIKALSPHSLSDLLERETGVFIKSYGGANLATSSIRGGAASHTALVWNGLPIESPMLGQLDLNLIPIGLMDQAQLLYSGHSTLWGSGSIGGTILLNNQRTSHSSFSFSHTQEIASFEGSFSQSDLNFSGQKLAFRSRVFQQSAQNNYPYSIRSDLPLRYLNHAYNLNRGLMQDIYYYPNPKREISLHVWLQDAYREIPPTMVQKRSEALQEDKSLRISMKWNEDFGRHQLNASSGLFREFLDYKDPLSGVESFSDWWTFVNNLEVKSRLSDNHHLVYGLLNSWARAYIEDYFQVRTRTTTAAFVQYLGQWNNLQFQSSLRQEWVDTKAIPLIPSLNMNWKLRKLAQLQASIKRNFRNPSLNDLYWVPGGNPLLKPEQGWSQELGIKFGKKTNKQSLNFSVEAYHRLIENWILWGFQEGQSYVSARNINKVRSRGLEARLDHNFQKSNWTIDWNLGYNLCKSTYNNALEFPRIQENEQLVYVPVHQAFAGIKLQVADFGLAYRHHWTSSVGTLNFSTLPSYHVANLSLNWTETSSISNMRWAFAIDNIWNTQYQVIENRPMPGRSYRLQLTLFLEQNIPNQTKTL